MKVPFVDLKKQNASIADELQSAVDGVVSNAAFILGPAVERFERAFAEYVGVEHCVGLNNGTSALQMALVAHDVGPGDEVITTPHTWISTSWAISYVGATPVFVDIDPQSWNITAENVTRAISPATKAILPVHLYGRMADVAAMRAIADEHSVVLIEDAAQAHGARLAGCRAGSVGHSACFSFYPGKNLGAFGEGGAVVTNHAELAARIRRLRDHAQAGRHNHIEVGFNTRMEGLQGAVLDVKLKHLDNWNERRRQHAERYCEQLQGIAGLTLPELGQSGSHVWHLFVILLDGIDRDRFLAGLRERGVAAGVHYPTPVPLQPVYHALGHRAGDFPVAERVMASCVSLPMCAELTDAQVDFTAQQVREVVEEQTVPVNSQ